MTDEDATDETTLEPDDYDIEKLRRFREIRLDRDGRTDYTEALAYIIELLEAIEDIEALVREVTDARVSEYEATATRIEQRAEDAAERAMAAERNANAAKSTIKSHRKQTENRVESFEDDLEDVHATAQTAIEKAEAAQDAADTLQTDVNATQMQQVNRIHNLHEEVNNLESRLERLEQQPATSRPSPSTDAASERDLDTPATESRLDRLASDISQLHANDHIDDVAWRLLHSRLDSLTPDTLDESDPAEAADIQTPPVEAKAPGEETNAHLGLLALETYAWETPASDWATAGQLADTVTVPTGDLDATALSKVLGDLHKTYGVAARRKTEAPNATWEYIATEAGRRILTDLGVHPDAPSVDPDEYFEADTSAPSENGAQ